MIYALNTKNDEHEDFVQKLRSLHEAEVQRLLTDSSSRLQKYQDEFTQEREGKERRVEELQRNLGEAERERDQLQEAQVSFLLPSVISHCTVTWCLRILRLQCLQLQC